MRGGHNRNCRITRIETNYPNTSSTSSEFPVEFGHGAKMKENTEVEAGGGNIAAELPAGTLGKTFGRLQFDDDAPVDEHINTMKADL